LPDPFGRDPEARIYKTGDLVRYREDGDVEYLGRLDHQVKIRGFRIELGEIQSVLAGHDDVVEAVVVAVDAASGEKRLAAYVVVDRGAATAFADDELRERFWTLLEQRLPDYMVPSSLSILEQLPLTTNGKLDKAALPAPSWDRAQSTGYAAPRSATEVAVAEIWREILQKDRVGVADNFFHLGGHSLLAARVITKVRKGLGVNPPVRALFEHPTLASFSDYVDGCTAENASEVAVRSQEPTRVGGGGQPLSYTQRQLHFFEELAPEAPVYNAAFGVETRGPIDLHALERAIGDVITRHEALRTVFVRHGEIPEQRTLDTWSFRIEEVELRSLPEEARGPELEHVIRERVRRPFDLSRDLLLRVALIALSETDSVILFETHHIVFDAWSVEIFYNEVSARYTAYLNGADPGLPALNYQYRDFAGWQREHLDARGATLDAYWRNALAGAPTVSDLPSDRPRPLEPSFAGGTFRFELSPETDRKIQRVCREENVTPYMLLLAAFATLLYRRTGSDDILFGTPAANRSRPEFEQMIGFLANTVVIRVRLGGNPTFGRLLARVRESALGAYDHQDAPFERIVEAARPRREHGVNPLFQVNFRVRTGQLPRLELPEVETAPLTIETGTARFDLALEFNLDGPSIKGEFGYNSDIFEASTVERLADDYVALLGQVLEELDTRLLSFEVGFAEAVEEDKGGASIKGLRARREAGAGHRE
jgi:Condensation domain/Phosphopantetheine attachment site/AMP-binding enzyme C-terminal domain